MFVQPPIPIGLFFLLSHSHHCEHLPHWVTRSHTSIQLPWEGAPQFKLLWNSVSHWKSRHMPMTEVLLVEIYGLIKITSARVTQINSKVITTSSRGSCLKIKIIWHHKKVGEYPNSDRTTYWLLTNCIMASWSPLWPLLGFNIHLYLYLYLLTS